MAKVVDCSSEGSVNFTRGTGAYYITVSKLGRCDVTPGGPGSGSVSAGILAVSNILDTRLIYVDTIPKQQP